MSTGKSFEEYSEATCVTLEARRIYTKYRWFIFVLLTSFAGPALQLRYAVIAHPEHLPRKAQLSQRRVRFSRQQPQIPRRPHLKLVTSNQLNSSL
jgi:hypothetical protein